jgi:LPXTG-site transpeptidase (sortase) family protein
MKWEALAFLIIGALVGYGLASRYPFSSSHTFPSAVPTIPVLAGLVSDDIAPSGDFLVAPGFDTPLPLIESNTLDEAPIQELLKQGAVILPLGHTFGEPGNMVITAHSSGSEAFGAYRFAFGKLGDLKTGDAFSIKTPSVKYTYKIFSTDIVFPTEVNKLPNDDRSTVTLVTCWPKFTDYKRLLVHGELTKTEEANGS